MRKLVPDDIYKLTYVSDAQISPNGEYIAFVKTFSDEIRNNYNSEIWIVNNMEEQYCITMEHENATMPRWSPNGKHVLFLSNKGGVNQLFIYSSINMSIEQLTFDSASKSFPVWSPDGNRVAFIIRNNSSSSNEEAVRLTTLKTGTGDGIKNISINKGIMILNIGDREVIRVAPEDFIVDDTMYSGVFNPSWSHDGQNLVFASRVQDQVEYEKYPWKAKLYIVDSKGGVPEPIKEGSEYAYKPIWSQDDKSIIYIGNNNELNRATSLKLCRVKSSEGKFEYLTKEFDKDIGDFTTCDFRNGYSEANPILSKTRNKIYFNASDEGKVSLYSLDLDSSRIDLLVGGDRRVYGFTMSADESRIAFCYSAVNIPNDIAIYNLDTKEEVRLTHVNKDILDSVSLAVPEELHLKTADGMKLHGWIMKPIDFIESNKYPGVLNIHGGPRFQWAWTFSFESQILAARGYAVMYCNARGSRGYGQEFTEAVQDDWGRMDYSDFMRFTDKALEDGYIDSEKLAVMGNSYGGFMTNWIISHTNRFKTAMSMGCVSDFISWAGTADTGFVIDQMLGLEENVDDLHELWKLSPLAYVKDIETPVLFMHGEKDIRCPIGQAEQMYTSLKQLGKQTEMIRFRDSGHTLHRNGRPLVRATRLTYILEYFDRYLLS